MENIYLHSKLSDKYTFPTKDNFLSPRKLCESEEYPTRIGESYCQDGTRMVFWVSPLIVNEDGTETSPWIEFSKRKHIEEQENKAKKITDGYKCRCKDFESDFESESEEHSKHCYFNKHSSYEWHISPTMKYTLSETSKIYHFHNADDYQTAILKYPGYEYGSYMKGVYLEDEFSPSVYHHLVKQYQKFFVSQMKKEEQALLSTGYTKKDIDSIRPKSTGPYIYHEYKNCREKCHISSFDSWTSYANIDTYRVKKSLFNKPEKAYAQLKYHSSHLETIIKEYWEGLISSKEPDCLDYDAMRADGYDGFHLHEQAIVEARERSEAIEAENEATRKKITSENSETKFLDYSDIKKDIYSIVTWWETDSMCVWNWCFE